MFRHRKMIIPVILFPAFLLFPFPPLPGPGSALRSRTGLGNYQMQARKYRDLPPKTGPDFKLELRHDSGSC